MSKLPTLSVYFITYSLTAYILNVRDRKILDKFRIINHARQPRIIVDHLDRISVVFHLHMCLVSERQRLYLSVLILPADSRVFWAVMLVTRPFTYTLAHVQPEGRRGRLNSPAVKAVPQGSQIVEVICVKNGTLLVVIWLETSGSNGPAYCKQALLFSNQIRGHVTERRALKEDQCVTR